MFCPQFFFHSFLMENQYKKNPLEETLCLAKILSQMANRFHLKCQCRMTGSDWSAPLRRTRLPRSMSTVCPTDVPARQVRKWGAFVMYLATLPLPQVRAWHIVQCAAPYIRTCSCHASLLKFSARGLSPLSLCIVMPPVKLPYSSKQIALRTWKKRLPTCYQN